MKSTEKRTNKIWLSVVSVGVVIAIILGVVALVNPNDTTANAIPTINQQVDNIKNTLPELEAVSTELKGYIDTLETTVEKLQTDLTAINTVIDTLETEVYGKVDAEKTATLNQLKADNAELEGKIAAANKAIEDAKTANAASEKVITDSITALETALKQADADAKSIIEAQITALQTALEKADSDNKKVLEDSISALKTQVESGDASLNTAIQTLNTNLSALIKANADNIAALQTTATDLQKQITDTNTEIDNIKTELESKITESEQKVLGEVNTLKTSIEGQIATVNNEITELKAKDTELDVRIAFLETYVDTQLNGTKEWASATFATLAQYDEVQTTISEIKALIQSTQKSITTLEETLNKKISDDIANAVAGVNADIAAKVTEITDGYKAAVTDATDAITAAYTEAIKTAITASETSMKTWVNDELQKVYGKITVLQEQVDALDSGEVTDAELATAVSEQQKALDDAVDELKADIASIIADNGTVNTAVAELSTKLDTISDRLTNLEDRVTQLENKVERMNDAACTISFLPTYSDGKAAMDYQTKTATINFLTSGIFVYNVEGFPDTCDIHAFLCYLSDPSDRTSNEANMLEWKELEVISANTLMNDQYIMRDSGYILQVTLNAKSYIRDDNDFILGTEDLSDDFWSGNANAMLYICIEGYAEYGLPGMIVSDVVPLVPYGYNP